MTVYRIKKQKIKNELRTMALMAGMLGLMLALGYFIMGVEGMIWAGAIGAIMLVLTTQVPPKYVMRMYRGRVLPPAQAPQLSRMLKILAKEAGLSRPPALYYIPSQAINAFATGNRKDPAIALTHGIITQLDLRELTGVMAHEMSHISNNDFRLKILVTVMARITRVFAMVGQLFLLINLPLYLMGEATIPWIAIILLLLAPYLSGLMVSALSRTREREADLEAARLTGDPRGLADALRKLNLLNQGNLLERMVPRALNTHPETQERVRRLYDLAPHFSPKIDYFQQREPRVPYRQGEWSG